MKKQDIELLVEIFGKEARVVDVIDYLKGGKNMKTKEFETWAKTIISDAEKTSGYIRIPKWDEEIEEEYHTFTEKEEKEIYPDGKYILHPKKGEITFLGWLDPERKKKGKMNIRIYDEIEKKLEHRVKTEMKWAQQEGGYFIDSPDTYFYPTKGYHINPEKCAITFHGIWETREGGKTRYAYGTYTKYYDWKTGELLETDGDEIRELSRKEREKEGFEE